MPSVLKVFGIGVNHSNTSSNATDTFSGSRTPVAPEDWLKQYGDTNNYFGAPGSGGLSDDQKKMMGIIDQDSASVMPQLQSNTNYFEQQKSQPTFTLNNANLKAQAGEAGYAGYKAPTDVKAQSVAAGAGADFMGRYKNPWETDVVQASLGDLGNERDRLANQRKMASAAGGAYGGGRQGVAEAQDDNDYLRNVASTTAGIRSQGFTTAAGLGQTDASRKLQADSTNAGNTLQADEFNNNLLDSRQKADIGAVQYGQDFRLRAAEDEQKAILDQHGLNMDQVNAMMQTTGMGFDQIMALLAQGTNLFGQIQESTDQKKASGSSTSISAHLGAT